MAEILYCMSYDSVRSFGETKDLLSFEKKKLLLQNQGNYQMNLKAAKQEILEAARVYDYDSRYGSEYSDTDFYTIESGIAKIPVEGLLVEEVNVCAAFFGEKTTSYRFIMEAIDRAEADPFVTKIALMIDSTGGYLSYMDITGQKILSTLKPIYAIAANHGDSAAYFLAACCDEIILTSQMGDLGSISIIAEIVDRSKDDEANGMTRKYYTNTIGKKKMIDDSTEAGQELLIGKLDSRYSVFRDRILIKRSEKLSADKIDKLEGDFLIGQEALEYGLADKMMDADDVINYLNGGNVGMQSAPLGESDLNNTEDNKAMGKELNAILLKSPGAKAEYEEEIGNLKAENKTAVEAALTAERKRVGHLLLLSGVKLDGVTSAALTTGQSVDEFAVSEAERKQELLLKGDSGADLGGLKGTGDKLGSENVKDAKKIETAGGKPSVLDRYEQMLDKKHGSKEEVKA